MKDSASNLEQLDYNQSYKCWSGFDIVARLENMGLGPKHFQEVTSCIMSVFEIEEDAPVVRNQQGEVVKLSNAVKQMLEHFFQPLIYIYKDDMKYVEDYRLAVLKSTSHAPSNTDGMWLQPRNRRGGLPMVPTTVLTLNFWCMNPAVAFSDLSNTMSIVLTSGTLSPMSTFQSELGTPFPIQLEANHIIKESQVWVGAISQGPKGVSTQAVYKTMDTFTFQDELGEILHKVCMTVPHGVLCFLPSYKALQKFTDRWKATCVWDRIVCKKRIFTEPKSSDKMDFEEVIKMFYDVIEDNYYDEDDDDDYEINGALFLAVCRGKVSEGLDFANNHARAVITVGIPYPNFTDIQVKLKREYNDKHCRSRGLLSGSDWYEIQAFRALNQALGRCLRHRKDWGALILLDARFVNMPQRYCKGLSKWMRNRVHPFNNFNSALSSLSDFTKLRLKDDAENLNPSQDASFLPMTPSVDESAVTPSRNQTKTSPECSLVVTPIKKDGNASFTPSTPIVDLTLTPEAKKSPNSTITPVRQKPSTSHITSTPISAGPQVIASTPISAGPQVIASTPISAGPQVIPPLLNQSQITYMSLPAGTAGKTILIPITPVTKTPVQTLQSFVPSSNCSQMVNLTPVPAKTVSGQPMKSLLVPANDMVLNKPANVLQTINIPRMTGPATNTLPSQPMKILFVQNNNSIMPNSNVIQINSDPAQKTTIVVPNSTSTAQTVKIAQTNSYVTNIPKQPVGVLMNTSNTNSVKKNDPQSSQRMNLKQSAAVHQSAIVKGTKINKTAGVENIVAEPTKKEVVIEKTTNSVGVENIVAEPVKKEIDVEKTTDSGVENVVKPTKEEIKKEKTKKSGDENNVESKSGVEKTNRFLKFCKIPDRIERILAETNTMIEGHALEKHEETTVKTMEKENDSNTRRKRPLFRKKSADEDLGDMDDFKNKSDLLFVQNSLNEGKTAEEDSEDTLNTKRRSSGGKRRQNFQKQYSSKRFKGVNFQDETDTSDANQGSSTVLKTFSCLKCKSTLVCSRESEIRKRIPSFLKGLKQNHNLIFLPQLPEDNKLQTLSHSVPNGVMLNCTWDRESACCVRYLQCADCLKHSKSDNIDVVGAEVMCSNDSSDYTAGQTWLFSSFFKMS